jgi:uncharacterized protein YbjT (DUF2867 family)
MTNFLTRKGETTMFRRLIFMFSIAALLLTNACWAENPADTLLIDTGTSKAHAKKGLVLVAGATGGTGRLVVQTLVKNGFHVRAFVRDVERAKKLLGSKIDYAKGDVREIESIKAALKGVTYIISAIGAGPGGDAKNGPEFVDYRGVKNLCDAVSAGNLDQFVLVSSMWGTHEDHYLNKAFDNVLKWKLKGEEVLRTSGVPYTIVRPGGLTDEAGGQYEILFKQGDKDGGLITRADVARVCVAALEVPAARNKTFEVINGSTPPAKDWQALFAGLKPDTK